MKAAWGSLLKHENESPPELLPSTTYDGRLSCSAFGALVARLDMTLAQPGRLAGQFLSLPC